MDAEKIDEAYRELYPDEAEKIDAIARIIDPGAFPGPGYDGTGPDAKVIQFDETPRMRYMQSRARRRAHEVLRYLGLAVEVDFVALLKRAAVEEKAQ